MTPVRGLTTKWSVSCMPYFTGDPSGSWPFRTNTSVPTLVDSESGKPVGYPPASRIGGSFTLLPAGTARKKRCSGGFAAGYIDHGRPRNPFLACTLADLFISLVKSPSRAAERNARDIALARSLMKHGRKDSFCAESTSSSSCLSVRLFDR